MPDLSRDLRRSLEATVKAAREAAETGAAASLRRLGVDAADLPAHLEPRRAERNRLRAHARSLGDRLASNGTHEIRRLTEAAAYVQWHRLLFARFLLERWPAARRNRRCRLAHRLPGRRGDERHRR